ncbi:hypothetical protein DPMN_126682 [Dreissena polymorpha]|uniref:Uncharacterized protein n=1 Tax=Dreissena polymorpha TaxID=45954 RepID=A0A9D4GWI1_DREPO|nr:hypothetical protein DPMN_126682 [Dreissena polymorpha]
MHNPSFPQRGSVSSYLCFWLFLQDTWLDEASGIKKDDSSLVAAVAIPKTAVSTSWNKKVNIKPQLFKNPFRIKIGGSRRILMLAFNEERVCEIVLKM